MSLGYTAAGKLYSVTRVGGIMKGLLIAGASALLLAGCGAAPMQITDRRDYLAEATRVYPGEDKERVIQAAETIIKISDPSDIDVRYVNNGFSALRRYFIYLVLAATAGQEKWDFHVEERSNAIEAALSISEAGTAAGGASVQHYNASMNAIPLYRLFWKRMDYMLGRRPDWTSCDQEARLLESLNTNPAALGGLCGPTSDGRDSVPQPLPARAVTASERISADRGATRRSQMNRR